jgi:hypothetical protein
MISFVYKKMVNNILVAVSLSSLLMISNAQAEKSPPEKCPDVTALAAVNLDYMENMDGQDEWIGIKFNNQYDTVDSWSFLTDFRFPTKDNVEALKLTMKKILSLHLVRGPEKSRDKEDAYECQYAPADGSGVAFAMTPAVTSNFHLKISNH